MAVGSLKRMVSIAGGDPCEAEEEAFAGELGRRMAEAGLAIVTGGRGGVMRAACRGARQAQGVTIGILPGTDRSQCNEFVDYAIPTGMGELRNGLVVTAGEVLVAIGGEFGTLSEIAFALKARKPVIGWRTWPIDEQRAKPGAIIAVASIDEACKEIEMALKRGRSR
jgi:uncharacterized protein (TIGR00725 family)